MKYFLFLISIIFIFSAKSFAQERNYISGKVIDKKTNKILPFVNIVYNEKGLGTTTNINGEFFINHKNTKELYISYLGYYSDTIKTKSSNQNITIRLTPKAYSINEIIVFPGVNPAERIINKVIENKNKNNPEKHHSFSYTSYNKNIFTLTNIDTTNIITDSTIQKIDSSEIKLQELIKKQHLFIIESISKRKFLYPDLSNEKIIATKISGTRNPFFSMLSTQLQSFSFYKDFITLFNKNYLNPISKGSINKYLFLLEDTMFTSRGDTLFVISYRPRKGKNFDGLTGFIHINTNKYAIQNVVASPSKKDETYAVTIEQKYEFIANKQWFPKQLNTEIIFNNTKISSPSSSIKLISKNKSYLSNIKLDTSLKKADFNINELNITKNSSNKTKEYWNKYRTEQLNSKDTLTYHIIDSIGEKHNIDKILSIFETAMSGYIPYKFFNFDLNKFYDYNLYEGLRLGIGGITNNKLSKSFAIGGHFAYGFNDKNIKYGGEFQINLNNKTEEKIHFTYNNDVTEASGYNFSERRLTLASSEIFRKYLISNMNKIEEKEISYSSRILKYLESKIYLNQSKVIPTNGYTYQISPSTTSNTFLFTETGMKLRYAFREKFIQIGRVKYPQGTKYPIIQANIIKGIDKIKGEYNYTKFETKITDNIKSRTIGETSICIVGGIIIGNIPAPKLYNGHGSYYKFSIVSDNSFGTMRMSEFYSDRFISIFLKQYFGHLLFSSKNFSPNIALVNNFGIGTLSNIGKHNFPESISSMEKGYFETGLHINNILNQSFFGYGIGIYYRYGAYSFSKNIDNFAFKLSFTINL